MNLKKILTLMCCLLAGSAFYSYAGDPRASLFTDSWRFSLSDPKDAMKPDFNDSGWRLLNLPHDWAIEGDFSKDNPSGTGGGALPGGIGWYRKDFTMPDSLKGKMVFVDFDGAYMNSTVYINGTELGTRPYGYASFSYDITPYIKWGKRNVIAVRVDNAEQPNSRWYSGCGIYRNVWLRVLNPVHVALWGTFVTTPEVSAYEAKVNIATTVDCQLPDRATYSLATDIFAPDGRLVASDTTAFSTDNLSVSQSFVVKRPSLWSPSSPALYTAVSQILQDDNILDSYSTPFGIRYFEFDAERGFSLNGQPMKINGVCMHHDLGALGAAVNTRAIERQLEILKEMGVNGYRCSHNPPAPEVLELCDRMGFIVMDETFDMWRKRKTSHDYSRYFDEWHERDLTDLLRRDRNHPSVIMWSIGNEVLEQWSDASADTLSLEEANMILNFGHSKDMLAAEDAEMSVNSLLTKKLADMTRTLDPTRPVTSGCNEGDPGNHLFRSGALDIIGYNYNNAKFKDVPQNFPGKPFIISESVSALQTRGFYVSPSDSMILCPVRWDIPYFDESFKCSAYDNCHAPWGSSHENNLRQVLNNDYISGQFIWTGFDYIGEPTPYGWPARSSYFGIVDLAGFPKDVYYMYQSEWRPDKQVLHLFPHWNHTPGDTVDMWCFYNNADEVELFINGVSQGVRRKSADDLHAMWRVVYEPGDVSVIARRGGKIVAEQTIATAGVPYRIVLEPDRSVITADGRDLSFITAKVVDKDGKLCPEAENLIEFEVKGAGFNAGVDNGCQTSLERFKDDKRKAFYGKALLIVQNNGDKGDIDITASSSGLLPARTTVKSR